MSPDEKPTLGGLGNEEATRYLRPHKKFEVRRRASWRKMLRLISRLFLTLGLVTVLSAVLYQAYQYARSAPRFRLESVEAVEIANNRYVPTQLVRECFQQDAGHSIFFIPLEARRRALEEIPWVWRARVQRILPNRLRVVLEERIPVAFLRHGGELMLIDAEGVVLEKPEGASFAFPVLSGFRPALTRAEHHARVALYLEFLRELDQAEKNYSRDISEIDLSDSNNLRAIVSKNGQAVLLHFGRGLYQEKYEAYLQHRSLWQKSAEAVYAVDLRYRGQLVLNPDSAPPSPSQGGRQR